jgi:excinuclease ABC subunit C
MDAAKRKTLTHSSLTRIKGIGDAKAKALLAAFGGITGVKNATEEEIAAVKGISKADAANIRSYYDTKK